MNLIKLFIQYIKLAKLVFLLIHMAEKKLK